MFDEFLNMGPFCAPAQGSWFAPRQLQPQLQDVHEEQHVYKLRAVIVHIGGAEGGHYVTYRNTSTLRTTAAAAAATQEGVEGGRGEESRIAGRVQSRWMLASDDSVSMVTLTEVLLCKPYMLFYEQC